MKTNLKHRTKMAHRMSAVLIAAILAVLTISACGTREKEEPAKVEKEHADKHSGEHSNEISLSPETLEAAKLEFGAIASRPAGGQLRVAGSVEINQQQMQQATPLVSGRVERVYVALGDRVRAGQPLGLISSPQIAQMHGKLHEAETKLGLAERELERVLKAENRVEVLKARARLDQAEAALKRTSRLIELGAGTQNSKSRVRISARHLAQPPGGRGEGRRRDGEGRREPHPLRNESARRAGGGGRTR
jgi:multidrug efflux pump subunit AcrA (membrane-fusion protein)